MALSVVPFSMLNLIAECFRGLRLVHYSSLVQAVLVPAISCCLLILLVYAGMGLGASIASYVLSTFLVFAAGLILFWRVEPRVWNEQRDAHLRTGEMLTLSLPMAWIAVMSYLLTVSDTVILSMYRPSSDVGIYTAALRLATLTGFILVAVNTILAPRFAALFHAGEMVRLEQLARNSTRMTLLVASPLFLLFVVTPRFITAVYGRDFTAAAVPLMIVSIGQFVNVAAGSVGLLLSMTGNQVPLKRIMISSALLNVVLSFVLIPKYGLLGAAVSNAMPVIAANIASTYQVKRNLNITVSPFGRASGSC
jgi:O-antigen/teichoic acid export membrane protein